MFTSIRSCLPSNGHLPSKVLFHQRLSSIKGCLPSKAPSGHFGFCRWSGIAGSERVPPVQLGWYLSVQCLFWYSKAKLKSIFLQKCILYCELSLLSCFIIDLLRMKLLQPDPIPSSSSPAPPPRPLYHPCTDLLPLPEQGGRGFLETRPVNRGSLILKIVFSFIFAKSGL